MKRLEGKTAVVTGGGSGIGLATARRFVAEGAFVYVFGRRREALEAAVSELGPSARSVQGDVTKLEDLERLFATVKEERGTLDVLFANAGVGDPAPLGQITAAQYDRTFDINVKGMLFTVQQGLPLLGRGSSVILTGSTVGVMGTAAMSVYSASKAAVRNLARSWAQDLRGTGIRVNVLSPGATRTDALLEFIGEEAADGMAQQIPLGRLADPAETASVAVFLASDDSSYMTGGEVFVDGGHAQV